MSQTARNLHRSMMVEMLESRRLLAVDATIAAQDLVSPYSNRTNPADVNADGSVNEKDVGALMNMANGHMPFDLCKEVGPFPVPYPDVNGDWLVTPQDVLQVINQINRERSPGEGESKPPVSPFQNPNEPADTNADGTVNVSDAVALVTMLSGRPAIDLNNEMGPFPVRYPDVNGDGLLTRDDAFQILSRLPRSWSSDVDELFSVFGEDDK